MIEDEVTCAPGRTVRGRGLVEGDGAERVGDSDQAKLRVHREAAAIPVKILRRADVLSVGTYLTLATAPPLRTQSRLPASLNVRDIGNSPSEEIGSPKGVILAGSLGSIEKRDIVLDPGCTSQY